MSSPKVQIRCDSCNTKYNFALPPSVLDAPEVPIRFRCSVCAYRFNVEPDKLLEQQGASANIIRVKNDEKLHIHQELSEVQSKLDSSEYLPTDVLSVHGSDWIMLSEHPDLRIGEVLDDERQDDASEEVIDEVDDVSSEQQDWTQLDPFSESEEAAAVDEAGPLTEDVTTVMEDLEEGEEERDEIEEQANETAEVEEPEDVEESEEVDEFTENIWDEVDTGTEAVGESIDELAEPEETFFPEETGEVSPAELFNNEHLEEETAISQTYEEPEPDREEQTGFGFAADEETLAGRRLEDTKFDFTPDEEETEAIEEMIDWGQSEMDEVAIEESEEPQEEIEFTDSVWESYERESSQVNEDPSLEDNWTQEEIAQEEEEEEEEEDVPYSEINFLDEDDLEKSITAAMEEADFQQDEDTFSLVEGEERGDLEEVEVEYEEESDEGVFKEEAYDEEVEDEEEAEEEEEEPKAPKERLSFHDKESHPLDEEGEIKKEANSFWVLVALLVVCIGILFYIDANKKKKFADVSGVKTSPEEVTGDIPNKGLQEGDAETTESADESTEAALASVQREKPPEIEDDEILFEPGETPDDKSRRGWQALNTNNPSIAITLFKSALNEEPQHFYASAGLGKAYEANGQAELAGKQYCKTAGIPTIDYDDMQYWLGFAEQVGIFCQ